MQRPLTRRYRATLSPTGKGKNILVQRRPGAVIVAAGDGSAGKARRDVLYVDEGAPHLFKRRWDLKGLL